MFMQKLTPQAPQTEQQQIGEFATVRRKILQIQDDWNTFHEEFSQLDSPYTEEFQQHNQDFSQAVNKILAAIATEGFSTGIYRIASPHSAVATKAVSPKLMMGLICITPFFMLP